MAAARRRGGARLKVLLLLCLAAAATVVRADAAASSDPAELIVPTGHDTQFDKVDELQNQLQQKVGTYTCLLVHATRSLPLLLPSPSLAHSLLLPVLDLSRFTFT